MRKLVSGLFISMDGVTDEPEKWQMAYYNDELGQLFASSIQDADAALFGARSYKRFKAVFEGKTNAELPFAEFWNTVPKYVVSISLKSVDWQNSQLLSGNVAEEILKLKQQPGNTIVTGASATLVRWLLDEGLLDELHLTIHPIVVGFGKRLFEPGGRRVSLHLLDSKTLSTGAVYVAYAPEPSAAQIHAAAATTAHS
jgi:dihydrofolate reductase